LELLLRKLVTITFLPSLVFLVSCNGSNSSGSTPSPTAPTPQVNGSSTPTPPTTPTEAFPPKVILEKPDTNNLHIVNYRNSLNLAVTNFYEGECIPGAAMALAGIHYMISDEIASANQVALGSFDSNISKGSLIVFFDDVKKEGQTTYKWYFELSTDEKSVTGAFFEELVWSKLNIGTIQNPIYQYQYVSKGFAKCDPRWSPEGE
jgi:hypothetical protein